tara:strand:+ start:1715 stop:2359 length:645 start_codon:yes stop_codon:yes gene_type:complete
MKNVNGLWLPDSDEHFRGPGYEHATRQTALGLCPGRGLAIDIGAHVGIWSVDLAQNFDRVVSFEPNPENRECLVKNLEGVSNVDIRKQAVSDRDDMGTLTSLREGNSGMWGLARSGEQVSSSSYFVKTITLDSLSFQNVDFIKIDAEGHEAAVLRGARETINRSRPTICLEAKSSKDMPLSAVMNVLSDTFDRFDIGYIPHRTGSEIIYTAEVA